jgi:hypothetical protein
MHNRHLSRTRSVWILNQLEKGARKGMFGPYLPTEKHRHADRLQVWKNAAKYALNMNSIKVVSEWRDQKALVIYMQGLLTTALVCVRTDLPNSAHYSFNIFRGTANIFRSVFNSSCLSTHVGKAPNNSRVSQSARLKHCIITAHCNLATGRSRRTAILHPSSQWCGPAGAHGSAAASTVYKSQI